MQLVVADLRIDVPDACRADASAAITVCVLDEHGVPVSAERVYWYLAPGSDAYDGEHALACVDQDCTVWRMSEMVSGPFYFGATRSGQPHADPLCEYSAYEAGLVKLERDADDEVLPQRILAVLKLHESCI